MAVPALSAASPLIALPAITSAGGASVWAAVAIGQSIGLAGATVVELGWGLNGPQRLARARKRNRRKTLALSVQTRLLMFPIVALVTGALGFVLAPQHNYVSALTAVGATATGLNLVWFFIGIGSPARLLLSDAVPRLVLVTGAAVALLSGSPIWIYPVLGILAPALIAPLVGLRVAGVRHQDFRGLGLRRTLTAIRFQTVPMSGRLVSALYIALPITLVSIVAPQAVPTFAAAERLQRMYLSLLAAVPNALQSWVGKTNSRVERLYRAEISTFASAGIGLAAGIIFAAFAPVVSRLVFSGTANLSFGLGSICGCVILFVCISRATGGLVLVALGMVRVVARSALIGAIVGIPAILFLGHVWGASGGLAGEIIAEGCVLAVQVLGWLRRRNRKDLRGMSRIAMVPRAAEQERQVDGFSRGR